MNCKNFTDYLFTKMEKNEANMSIYALTDKCDIGCVLPNESFNLEVMCKKNFIAWGITGYKFEEKHRKSMVAFVNSHNDKSEGKYKLHIKGNNLICADIVETTDEAKTIEIIEDVVSWFTVGLNDVINRLHSSAKTRADIIRSRVDELKTRACAYENSGEHIKAKKCYFEICQYYGYGHMELIAMLYGKGKETKWGMFPANKEYQLEYQMIAVEKDKNNKFAPMIAYNLAKNLGKSDLCEKLIAIGQERGTWNTIALSGLKNSNELLERIARCYREGIGCEANETYAMYYDRLLKGERQEVFKDMLIQGFEPVFELMNSNQYYEIQELSELDSLSDEFKQRFLYGESKRMFDLPEWFAPVVNSLSDKDKEVVLINIKSKFIQESQTFISKVKSSEFEVISECDSDGVLVEDGNTLQFVSLPDLTDIKSCGLVNDIAEILLAFKNTFKLSGNDKFEF